jgi:uncharacterized membrane-anchored protein
MRVDLVLDPSDMQTVLPQYSFLIGGFNYKTGNRYAEFMRGDKVAGYGLTALIAGGLGAAAVKTGLLAKLWKFVVAIFLALWKLIIFVIAGLAAFVKRMFVRLKGMFQGKDREAPAMQLEAEHAKLELPAVTDQHDFK